MTPTSAQNREAAILGMVTAAFVYSGHLTGKARLGNLSDGEARHLLKVTRKAKTDLVGKE